MLANSVFMDSCLHGNDDVEREWGRLPLKRALQPLNPLF
jgi:hypothetical protein